MTRTLFSTAAWMLLISVPATAPANDIVNFLRALNGISSPARHAPVVQPVGHRHERLETARFDDHYRGRRPVTIGRPGSSFHVSFGTQAPPVPSIPVLPPPVSFHQNVLPHQIGEIVRCPVPLEPHVVIKDACEVAPGAVPVVIAVRDPHLGRYGSRGCVERLVYVEVLVPPCPVQRIRVSPCRTKVRLDYGRYEVDIVSRNDCVVIEYDD